MTIKTLKQSPVIIEYNSFTDSLRNVLALSVVEPRRGTGRHCSPRKERGQCIYLWQTTGEMLGEVGLSTNVCGYHFIINRVGPVLLTCLFLLRVSFQITRKAMLNA